jgi:hypothetical protein
MMRKLFFTLFLFGIFANGVYGQDSLAYKSKWQIKTLVGTNVPITKLLQGKTVDYLLIYDDHLFYWNESISCFFHKHWGLELNFQLEGSKKLNSRADNFITSVQSEYDDKYYVQSETSGMYDKFHFFNGDIGQFSLGVVYRLEINKFYAYPKLLIGMISFTIDEGHANVKEKNSNYEYKVSYSGNRTQNNNFIITPSVSFGYQIIKRLYVNADIMFPYFKTNIVFEKEFTNLYTKEKTVEYFDYKKNIFTFSLGAGITYVMR